MPRAKIDIVKCTGEPDVAEVEAPVIEVESGFDRRQRPRNRSLLTRNPIRPAQLRWPASFDGADEGCIDQALIQSGASKTEVTCRLFVRDQLRADGQAVQGLTDRVAL